LFKIGHRLQLTRVKIGRFSFVCMFHVIFTGLMDFNVHLWHGNQPPESPLDDVSTARICSLIEAHFGLLVSLCGSGLLRLTDAGRSKVSNPKP
jgi:hypothetical protein